MRFSLLLMAMFAFLAANSQQCVVRGIVTDSLTREPIPGAVVRLTGPTSAGTVTDSTGQYLLRFAYADGLQLLFEYVGYTAQTKSVLALEFDATNETRVNISLAPKKWNAGPVVVSAGRFEQNLGEVTVSMEVIKPQLIQDKNTVSMDEILQQTPGVSIVDDEPQIRSGSGFSFGAGSRVQVLVDDLPMLSGDAGKTSWGFLPLENLSQVEVIKGASSVLYGSSALSGVVNMRTAYPGAKPVTRISVFHGMYSNPQSDSAKYWSSAGMRSGLFFFHSQQIGQWDLVIGGNIYGDDGHLGPIRDSATGRFTDGYDPTTVDRYNAQDRFRMNANIRYRFKKIPGLSAGLNTNWMKSESMATLIWRNSDRGLYDAFDGSATRTRQLLGTVDPFIVLRTRKGSRHALRARWQSLDNNNDNNQGNFSDVIYSEYQFQQNGNRWNIQDLNISTGAVSIFTTSRGQLYSGGNPDGVNTAQNLATYLQVDKKWGTRWNASAGVRYEYFRINNESQDRPVFRAGINYRAAQATFLRASYGQGYRFPSIAEKFIVTSLGAVRIFANPNLLPETSHNVEAGIKQGFKIKEFKGFLDIAFFQQEYTNFIEFTFGQWDTNPSLNNLLGLGFKSVNTGSALIRGAEVSMMGEGKTGDVLWRTLIGYTYTLPVSTTPNQVYATTDIPAGNPFRIPQFAEVAYANTSSNTSNDILKYRFQHLVRADVGAEYKSWSVGVSFRFNSYMQNIDKAFEQLEEQFPVLFNPGVANWRKRNPNGDHVFDARLGYNLRDKHKLAFVVSNLLNREYAMRPLAIEEPRVITIQYSLTIE
jgi:outer membrane receptor protein involved in Fe transport